MQGIIHLKSWFVRLFRDDFLSNTSPFYRIFFLINAPLGMLFWYTQVGGFHWKNLIADFLFVAIFALLGLWGILFSLNQKASMPMQLYLASFFWFTFSYGSLIALPTFIDIDYDPNLSCDENRFREIYSPDKSKELVICDVYGPSGVLNVQVHYLSFPYIKRDFIRETYGYGNEVARNYWSSRWVDNDVLYTQDPSQRETSQMIYLNIWWVPGFFQALIFIAMYNLVSLLIGYVICRIFQRIEKWLFSTVSKQLQKF